MKYEIPSILDLKHGYLTDEEKEFFREELNIPSIDHDIMEYWQTQFDRVIVLAEEEAERKRLEEEKKERDYSIKNKEELTEHMQGQCPNRKLN